MLCMLYKEKVVFPRKITGVVKKVGYKGPVMSFVGFFFFWGGGSLVYTRKVPERVVARGRKEDRGG